MNTELREKGYIPCKGLLEPRLARVIYKTLLLKQWRGECFRDNHIPTAVSVSIHLGRDGGEASLCFPPNTRVEMEEGDGAVYLGVETDHWREPFTGNTMGQLFLHYVVADGPYAAPLFDR